LPDTRSDAVERYLDRAFIADEIQKRECAQGVIHRETQLKAPAMNHRGSIRGNYE